MSYPKVYRDLRENEGAGPRLREDIMPIKYTWPYGGVITEEHYLDSGGKLISGIHISTPNGAMLSLRDPNAGNNDAGYFYLSAGNASQRTDLIGTPDGGLYWNGSALAISTGIVMAFAGNASLFGYLLCNGAAVSRTTYANLFAAIGTTYGTGDGSSTFNLPNLTDRFIQGSSTAGTVKGAGLPQISGTFWNTAGRMGNTTDNSGVFGSYMSAGVILNGGSSGTYGYGRGIDFYASRSSSVYGNSTTVQPPALTMRYYIKY